MILETDYIKRLLAKYRQGACAAEERLLVEEWLDTIKNEEAANFSDDFIDSRLNAVQSSVDTAIFEIRSCNLGCMDEIEIEKHSLRDRMCPKILLTAAVKGRDIFGS